MTLDILEFHRRTNHTYASVRRRSRGLDWANKPHPFKEYLDLPSLPLPTPRESPPLGQAGRLDLGSLAHILHYAAGVTRVREFDGEPFSFRAYASAGALYPIEIYVVVGEIDGLAAGVYHYHPGEHALRRLRPGDLRGHLVAATANDATVSSAPTTIVLTGIYWRTMWKYEARGYRHLYWDSGMVLANLFAVTEPMGIVTSLAVGFVDADVDRLLGLDSRHEVCLALVPLGRGPVVAPASSVLPAIDLQAQPLSRREIEYADALAAHERSRLRSPVETKAWTSRP